MESDEESENMDTADEIESYDPEDTPTLKIKTYNRGINSSQSGEYT